MFSNLKITDFGIDVWMELTPGTWSEVVISRGKAIVLGKVVDQETEEKNQSNL
jgi:hypothetical protein